MAPRTATDLHALFFKLHINHNHISLQKKNNLAKGYIAISSFLYIFHLQREFLVPAAQHLNILLTSFKVNQTDVPLMLTLASCICVK